MSETYTTEDLFREIDGKEYRSYRELEEEVIHLFNRHLGDFPPHYSYRDAIAWADHKRWLHPQAGRFVVEISQGAPA